jgi:hypothetical protein
MVTCKNTVCTNRHTNDILIVNRVPINTGECLVAATKYQNNCHVYMLDAHLHSANHMLSSLGSSLLHVDVITVIVSVVAICCISLLVVFIANHP